MTRAAITMTSLDQMYIFTVEPRTEVIADTLNFQNNTYSEIPSSRILNSPSRIAYIRDLLVEY